jgi:hypothetical protein
MSNNLRSQLRAIGVISLLVFRGMAIGSFARAACYNTPRAAIDAFETQSPFSPVGESNGFRVLKIQSDPVLRQKWATIATCGRPEWPVFATPVNGNGSPQLFQQPEPSLHANARGTPLVLAGEIIRLWRQEELLRIEMAGVSEDSGDLGKTIRVRLLQRNADQSAPAMFFGVVRGQSNVEIKSR